MNGEITYTFSRALRMMRYGGAIMKSDRASYYVKDEELYEFNTALNGFILALNIYFI